MLAEVIGHRLAEVRRARGLTQQQVADRHSPDVAPQRTDR
jgi:DNA-binding XRE family transcriptional regulator